MDNIGFIATWFIAYSHPLYWILIAIVFGVLWFQSAKIRHLFEKGRKELSGKPDAFASFEMVSLYSYRQAIELISDAFIGICKVSEWGCIISLFVALISAVWH